MHLVIVILLRVVEIYSFILLLYTFLTWIPEVFATSFGRLVLWLVRPVLEPFRRFNLQFLGLDWTAPLVMVLLNLVTRLLFYLLLSL
ncbi:YggT family protein [Streptococcus oriscaviae]|uniref:YggT family protein n=1 Tax=Streptococcus oriscaviae TaxID=2781599 RepID=A0ABX7YMF8_9STRE|nr:YggT family protein [Streptococcus oriscaviae]QUE55018.1 YggT family protein [Streptococcus oriscaviae]